MKKFKHTFREGLPGGPNEIKGTITGSVSYHGYKRNSPDVGNDFNIIPSQYITMVGVDFPVMGTDNLGNSKIMYPGNNYTFPGNYVTEIPAFGDGGLKQWFAEEWVDVKTGKECGRSGKDKDGRPYPACRPSRRVNDSTPKTTSEMSAAETAEFKRKKTSGKRIDYNHKRAQNGIEVKGRNGSRQNPDGTVSTHLMAREYVPGRGWVAFPTLFQNPDSTWVEIPMDQGWGAAYEEALKRGEVYDFGQDEQAAIKFADQGSWKKQTGGNAPEIPFTKEDIRDVVKSVDDNAGTIPYAKQGGSLFKAQKGGEETSWTDYINPMNWGVTNRDQDGDFKQAFRAARNAGDDEFMWYGTRYSTELAQPSTPNADQNKKKPSSNVLDLSNALNYLVDTRGGTRDLWGQAADTIAYHESWHTMDPATVQAGNGPARGMFQFEGPAFKTFKNRYKTVADSMGLDVDPAILNANSADELTAEQQYTAFLVNLIESKAVLKDFADGKMSIEDLWLQGHKNVEKPGDRESFRTSMQKAGEQGITGGYQSFAEGGEGGEDPPFKLPSLDFSALDAQFRNQAFGQAQESTYVANPMQGLTQFYEREESDNFGIENVSYEAPNLTSKYAKNVNSQAGLDFQSLTDKYYRKYSAANRPEVAQIQQTLIDEGYLPALNENGRSNADGLFGPRTKEALKQYSLKSQSGLVLNAGAIPSEIGDTRCAAGMCSILEQQGVNTAGLGIKYKDAWNMLESMNNVGESQTVYNIYDSPEFNNVKTTADIKSATRNVKRRSQTTADMYQVGDIVGLYWQNSSHHAETVGSKTHNTHVGFVSGFDANGQPIITHNVNGQVKNDRWDNLVTGWISRPTTASQVREVYQGDGYVNMEISPTVLDNYVSKRELTNPDPKKMSVVENVLKRVHYNAQVLPQKLGSSVDPTWLRNATAGILGNESAIGYNATRSRQEVEEADLKRKVGYTIQGKKDEDVSLGVGKVKFSSLDPFARSYFQVTSPEDLGDDNKNVDVTTYSLIRNYDLFSDYAQTFPQLELNEDDIRNMAILSHNQGTSRLLKLGRNADLQTVAEEVQRLRALYDSEIADVSSTNWRFFGETAGTLGMNVESAITGKSPASETYISKANRYGQTLYGDRKPGFRTLYEYMKATGIPATYDYREKIYQNYFDDEYRGTAAQNTALLNALQGS